MAHAVTTEAFGVDTLLADYAGLARGPDGLDEMVDPSGQIRPSWVEVGHILAELGPRGLADRQLAIDRLLQDDGVRYRSTGTDTERPWELDPLPMLVEEADWHVLEPALLQRSELLDAVLTDLYGERRLLRERLLPPEIVVGHAGYIREAFGIRLPGSHQLFLNSSDLARGADGRWAVLSDRTQAPSGAGYAMENRTVLSRALPGLYRDTGIYRIAPFFHTMRQSLQRLAAGRSDSPRIVLFSPGARSETAFDQAFLSSMLGFSLTTGADLQVRDGRVWQRSLNGLEPVDVILRRVDGQFCDPLELRADSLIGVPGLLEAARRGAVAIVNPVGAGVLENSALSVFLPRICRVLRSEDLILGAAQTWWCGEPSSRQHVLARLDELVLKPIARDVGHSSVFGWALTAEGRSQLKRRIEAEPWSWVGQSALPLSTAPTVQPGGLAPRPVTLRTFAVADGDSYQLMRGGLTRAAAAPGSLLVSNAAGAISKDVWVLSRAGHRGRELPRHGLTGPETVSAAVSPRVAEDLYWLGRYAERVESLARLLRVVEQRWRDLHPDPDPALARCLVVLLECCTTVTGTLPGFIGTAAASRLAAPGPELTSLITDGSRAGTLAHDLIRVRNLATAVRDQLSTDTWSVLAGLDRSLLPFDTAAGTDFAESGEFSTAVTVVLQSMLAFSGLVAESMVRDAGWALLDSGRRLERALQTVTLLATAFNKEQDGAETLIIESCLVAAESVITHRRRYPAHAGVASVLELLLADSGNPRSVLFQLERSADNLTRAAGTGKTAADRSAPVTACADLIERVRGADLHALSAPGPDGRAELTDFLGEIADGLRDVHVLIEEAHFAPPVRLRPLEGFGEDPA